VCVCVCVCVCVRERERERERVLFEFVLDFEFERRERGGREGGREGGRYNRAVHTHTHTHTHAHTHTHMPRNTNTFTHKHTHTHTHTHTHMICVCSGDGARAPAGRASLFWMTASTACAGPAASRPAPPQTNASTDSRRERCEGRGSFAARLTTEKTAAEPLRAACLASRPLPNPWAHAGAAATDGRRLNASAPCCAPDNAQNAAQIASFIESKRKEKL